MILSHWLWVESTTTDWTGMASTGTEWSGMASFTLAGGLGYKFKFIEVKHHQQLFPDMSKAYLEIVLDEMELLLLEVSCFQNVQRVFAVIELNDRTICVSHLR